MEEELVGPVLENGRKMSLDMRLRYYTRFAFDFEKVPLTDSEFIDARQLTVSLPFETMFHGGEAGLSPGETLLPSQKSGILPSERS